MSGLYHEEDEKYKDVINALKGLKKVDAPEDFEMNLFREINVHKHKKRPRLFFGILPRYTLIPASVVFTVLAVTVVILLNQTPEIKQVRSGESPVVQPIPEIRETKPEVADKKQTPSSSRKETKVYETAKPEEQSAAAARSESSNQPKAVSAGEEETAAPVTIQTDKITTTVRFADTTLSTGKAGKVTKTDTAKTKKKEIK